MSESEIAEGLDDEFGDQSDDDIDSDAEDIAEAFGDFLDADAREQLANDLADLDRMSSEIDDLLEADMDFDQIEAEDVEADPANDQDSEIKKLREDLKDLKEKIAEQSRPSRSKARIIVIALMVAGVVGGGIFFLVKYLKSKDPKPSDDFPQDALDRAKAVVDNFRARTESDFWGALATYVDEKAPGLQFQAMMMSYAKLMSATEDAITWGPTEKGDDATALIAARDKSGKDSDLYRTVLTLKHDSKDLSRKVRADICLLAIAGMNARAKPKT